MQSSDTLLKNAQTCAKLNTVTLPLTAYTELLQRVERLEKIILKQREIAIVAAQRKTR